MADVFLSYSRQDQTFVRQLFGALEVAGQETWVDWEDIPLTTDWWAEIREGIEEAKAFIFVMTSDSLASPVCTYEVDYALKLHKRIIPVLPAPFDHEAALEKLRRRRLDAGLLAMAGDRSINDIAETNWRTLAAINWVQFGSADFDTVARQLLDVLNTDYEHAKTHTRLLQRALEWERAGRPTALLLRGDAQREAEAWVVYGSNTNPEPVEAHRNYIEAGVKLRQREYARLRVLVVVLAVLLVMAVGAGILAVNRSQVAESESLARATQQTIAETNASIAVANAATAEANLRAQWGLQSLYLAEQSRRVLNEVGDTDLAINLALESLTHYGEGIYRREAHAALIESLNHPLTPASAPSTIENVIATDTSDDGRRYLLATQQMVYLWTPGSQDPPPALVDLAALGLTDVQVLAVGFIDAGESEAVAVLSDRSLRLTLDGSRPPVEVIADQRYEQAALSDDGMWVWAVRRFAPREAALAVWATDGSAYHSRPNLAVLQDAYFSPNNRYLAVPLHGEQTILIDLATDAEISLVGSSSSTVWWASEETVLVRDVQGTLRGFRLADGAPPVRLFLFGRVFSAAVSPDGTRVAVVTSDEMLRVLDIETGQQTAEMILFEQASGSPVWNAAQTHLMVWGREGVLLWELSEEFPQSISFLGGAFGLFTERHAVVAGDSSLVVIALEGSEAHAVAYPASPIIDIGLNVARGDLMVRAGSDPVRLWLVGQPQVPGVIQVPPDPAPAPTCDLSFFPDRAAPDERSVCSADGTRLAVMVDDRGEIWVWPDEDKAKQPVAVFSAPYPVADMRFSPDNQRLAVTDATFGRVQVYLDGIRDPINLPAYAEVGSLNWVQDGTALRLFNPFTQRAESWTLDVRALMTLGELARLRPMSEDERAQFYLSDLE